MISLPGTAQANQVSIRSRRMSAGEWLRAAVARPAYVSIRSRRMSAGECHLRRPIRKPSVVSIRSRRMSAGEYAGAAREAVETCLRFNPLPPTMSAGESRRPNSFGQRVFANRFSRTSAKTMPAAGRGKTKSQADCAGTALRESRMFRGFGHHSRSAKGSTRSAAPRNRSPCPDQNVPPALVAKTGMQVVQPQAVFVGLDLFQKPITQADEVRLAHHALEYRDIVPVGRNLHRPWPRAAAAAAPPWSPSKHHRSPASS